MAYSLNILAFQECVLSGAVMGTWQVEVLNSGVRDTAFTGNISVAKQTGNWTLSGNSPVACVAGVATFTALVGTGAGANAGAGTLRFTDATHSTTVDSASLIVRETPAAATPGAFTTRQTLRSSFDNKQLVGDIFVGAGYNGTPMPLIIFAGAGNFKGTDPTVSDATSFMTYLKSHQSTYGAFVIVAPVPDTGGGDLDKLSWIFAMVDWILRLIADGYTVDLMRISLYGWSTGAIWANIFMMLFRQLFACMVLIDPSYFPDDACTPTDTGAPFPPHFYDGDWVSGAAHTEMFKEMARTYVNEGTRILLIWSDHAKTNPFSPPKVYNNFDQSIVTGYANTAWNKPFDLLTSANNVMPTLDPTKNTQVYFSGATEASSPQGHTQVELNTCSTSNWETAGKVRDFIFAQHRTAFSVVPSTPVRQTAFKLSLL